MLLSVILAGSFVFASKKTASKKTPVFVSKLGNSCFGDGAFNHPYDVAVDGKAWFTSPTHTIIASKSSPAKALSSVHGEARHSHWRI